LCSYNSHLRFGGWVIDGFPRTRDHWAALVENDILPDSLIILDDHEAPENFLFSRFTNSHSISTDKEGTKTEVSSLLYLYNGLPIGSK